MNNIERETFKNLERRLITCERICIQQEVIITTHEKELYCEQLRTKQEIRAKNHVIKIAKKLNTIIKDHNNLPWFARFIKVVLP